MVLHTTQPAPAAIPENKENVVFKPSISSSSVFRNANGRRARSRPNNTLSPVVIAREHARDPARRRAQSPIAVTPTRTLVIAVEDADVEMTDAVSPPQNIVSLPRHLKRPTYREISPTAIATIDPDLKDVALEYIRQNLQNVGQQMFAVAAKTMVDPPRDRLPRELEVVVGDLSADVPTHLFAVYSKPSTRVAIHPAHALVLAAHCAHLPALPHSKPTAPTAPGSTIILPVVPLRLPNPSTFPTLMHYLYTKRGDHLLASLLPMPPRDASRSHDHLARSLAATFTAPALLSHAAKAHGMWSNVSALGIFDDKLWRAIEMAWEVLLGALEISTGASWRTESVQAQL